MADDIKKNVVRHAQSDMANTSQPAPEAKQSIADAMIDKRAEWAAEQPSVKAQLGAMWREGLKDLQNAILPAFPDSQRGVEEPGTPLNPTPQQVTQEQGNFHGYDPAENIRPTGPEKDRGRTR